MKKLRVIISACCLGMLAQAGVALAESKPVTGGPAAEAARSTNLDATNREATKSSGVPTEKQAVAAVDDGGMRRAAARRLPINYQTYQYQSEAATLIGTETMLSEISKEIAGKVYYELKELGENGLAGRVAITAAVPLSDFQRDSEFGRLVAEYLLTDIADRGLAVTELRIGKEIQILPQTGEFILTRNIGELVNSAPELDYVVVSTFSNTRKTLILQGRLVNLKDLRIISSWRHSLPLNREVISLFQLPEEPFTISVKGVQK